MLNPFFTGTGWAHYGDILRETTALVEAGSVRPLIDDERFSKIADHDVFRFEISVDNAQGMRESHGFAACVKDLN